MVLLVGATGNLGWRIAERLRENGERVRAMVRHGSGSTRLAGLGVEPVFGDLRDPRSLEAACRGVEAVVSTATAMARQDATIEAVDLLGHLDLVTAAENAGAQRFVYVSLRPPSALGLDFPLLLAKRAVEERLRTGGVEHTILLPGPLMEVWLTSLTSLDHDRRMAVSVTGGGRVAFVSAGDVALAASRAVRHPGAKDRTLALAGPEAVSLGAAISIFEAALGRPSGVRHVEQEALRDAYSSATDEKAASSIAMRLALGMEWPAANGDAAKVGLDEGAFVSVTEYARKIAGGRGPSS